ncbi:MAG: thioesterase family protein, partial [Betaproteobacteria bacterium]|nr:thioesterase family protein [Betaproteobacteria bacterium]NDG59213.1 thioesterase family protein [Betaproteobacteria bacterium]
MRRSQDEQQAFEQSLTEIFERHICFNQVLGLTVIALKPEQTEIRFAMR